MDDFEKYFNKALKFLSYRPRSEKEIRDSLARSSAKRRKTISPDIVEKIINQLKELRFLDDEEFVRWWIQQRSEFKPKPLKIIKLELRQKGIDRELIDHVMQNLELEVQNDLEKAKKLARKQLKRYEKLPKIEQKQKLGQFLARRGFDWETVKSAIDEILAKGV